MSELLEQGAERGLDGPGREALKRALQHALVDLRAACQTGATRELDDSFWTQVGDRLDILPGMHLRGVLNATGVVLHTNLGRAPWPQEAVDAVAQAAHYTQLEVDPSSGGRGRRDGAPSGELATQLGAEAALVVNNNAGAVLLALGALVRGRKVVVARGELVEIGGSYRMPAVVDAAGATAVEVGTTNRVHMADYATALEDPDVACVLKVHPSNFALEGFTADVPMQELADLCRQHAVPLVYDLGSGWLEGSPPPGAEDEPAVRAALAAGCDLVTFSGDKLLGGPQAGFVVGSAALVDRLRADPLMRCLRLDKTLLAALEATLILHSLGPEVAIARIPGLQLLHASLESLRQRARALAQELDSRAGISAKAVDCASKVGSGAAPVAELPGAGISLCREGQDAESLAQALRMGSPAVYARIQDDAVLLDLRALRVDQDEALLVAVSALG